MSSYDWIPKKSYGVLVLGDNINKYCNTLGTYLASATDPTTGWSTYYLPDADISIYVEEEKIICIEINDRCFYKGTNLIGLPLESVETILLCKARSAGIVVEYDDGDIQYPYEFSDFGLDIWVSEEKIVAASVSNF